MLAITPFKNAGDQSYQLEYPELMATNISNYELSEMPAIDVSSFIVQKYWRQTLTILMFRNAGDNNYNYNFWRAPHKL